jgi:hypothetical protein
MIIDSRHHQGRRLMSNLLEKTKPASWRIDKWLQEVSDPPPSRGSFYNWVNAGLIETAKVGDITLVLTDPHEFVARHRIAAKPARPVEAPPQPAAEPQQPVKRGRGRPPGSRNKPKPAPNPTLSEAPLPLAASSK